MQGYLTFVTSKQKFKERLYDFYLLTHLFGTSNVVVTENAGANMSWNKLDKGKLYC